MRHPRRADRGGQGETGSSTGVVALSQQSTPPAYRLGNESAGKDWHELNQPAPSLECVGQRGRAGKLNGTGDWGGGRHPSGDDGEPPSPLLGAAIAR